MINPIQKRVFVMEDRIVDFIREKGASKSCNHCGNDANDSSHAQGKIRAWGPNDYEGSYDCGEQMESIVLIQCNNCGNIQLFSERLINESN